MVSKVIPRKISYIKIKHQFISLSDLIGYLVQALLVLLSLILVLQYQCRILSFHLLQSFNQHFRLGFRIIRVTSRLQWQAMCNQFNEHIGCVYFYRPPTNKVCSRHSVHREFHVVTISHDALDFIIPPDIQPPASDMSKLVQLGPHCKLEPDMFKLVHCEVLTSRQAWGWHYLNFKRLFLDYLVTVRNEVAKVMFLQAYLSTRGGLPQCMLGYHPPGADDPAPEQAPPGADPPPGTGTPPRERRPLLRTVRILLECILVTNIFL